MSIDDESYRRRLESAIDQCYRTPHGQFLIQHILRIGSMLDLASPERREVAVLFMNDILSCRNGPAIARTALNQLISIQEDEEQDDGSYNPFSNDALLEQGRR